jgi:hypothetical protein|nr:hypothetical protein [Kofleriaceae bacterium]
MLRLAVACAVTAVAVTAAATPAKPGKVTRVERRGSAPRGTPRLCSLSVQEDASTKVLEANGYCFGNDVRVGETITAFNGSKGGTLRIDQTSPYSTCSGGATTLGQSSSSTGAPGVWIVHGAIDANSMSSQDAGGYYGMIDGGLDPARARIVVMTTSPSGRPADSSTLGVDRDGDGNPDFAFVSYLCDDSMAPTQTATNQCYEMYVADGHGMRRVHAEQLKSC